MLDQLWLFPQDDQLHGERPGREPVEGKWRVRSVVLVPLSASLVLWVVIFFVISQSFF